MRAGVTTMAMPRALTSWSGEPGAQRLEVVREEPAVTRAGRRRRIPEPASSEVAERFALLEQSPIFYTLPDPTLRALARRMRPISLAAGEIAIQQGEDASSILFIQSGHCQVRLEGPEPHSVAVALLSTADFFGELAVLDEVPAQHTVVALDDCQLLAIDRTGLYAVFGHDAAVLSQLADLGAQRATGYAGIAAQLGWSRTVGSCQVTAFYSPKGGSGRTTLALNVAGALAQRHPGQVLLLDLSFPFTQAALLANLVPVSSLAKLADAAPEVADELLLSAVLFHPGNLMVLLGCIRPEEADLITPDVINRTMEILRRTFRYVVVDLGVAMTDVGLAVFDDADRVLLVVPPELAAVKAAQDSRAIFTRVLGFSPDQIDVILNVRSPRTAISKNAVERRMGAQIAVEVGYDGSKPEEAALSGQILSLSDKASEVSRGAARIADLLEAVRNDGPAGGTAPKAPVSERAEP
jgi:MinD-like ATPase involved in chromosome partitioning or flagellar assembly